MPESLERIDHIHVFVTDRAEAEAWYARVLGFERLAALERWSADGGPLTVASAGGGIHIALFESRDARRNRTAIALLAGGRQFLDWWAHLSEGHGVPVRLVDHELAWSLYFADPYGNPYEITSYDYGWLARRLRPS